MYPNNTIILVSNGGRRQGFGKDLIGVIAVMLLGWLQMAIKMQRVGNTKTGCAVSFIFFLVKNESTLYIFRTYQLKKDSQDV